MRATSLHNAPDYISNETQREIASLMPLKPLNFPLMLLSRPAGTKGAEIAAMASVGIGLTGIKPIFAGFEFANHKASDHWGKPQSRCRKPCSGGDFMSR
jgi:hypothetical protein